MADKQIAGLTAGAIGLTNVIPFQDAAAASEAKKTTVQDIIDLVQEQVAPYKVYSFYAEQFSTNAPVVNEEQNTTGATITWSRVSTGRIRGTASSAIFTANKTTVLISGNGGDVNSPVLLMPVVVSTTVIDIVSYSSSFVKQDGFNLSGEIKIYP